MENNNLNKAVDVKDDVKKTLTETVKKIVMNLGYILSGIGGAAYLIIIVILVRGVSPIEFNIAGKDGWFFGIGLVFGLWIRTGFYIQGVSYAKDENKDLIQKYHKLKVKDKPESWKASFELKMTIEVIINTVFQIVMFVVSSVGFVYVAGFEGINHPVYLWSALSNLIMFAGFGMLALVKTYEKYNNLKVPVLEERVRLLEKEQTSEKTHL